MYSMLGLGVIIAVVLFLFGFFVEENCAIKNGLILRKHGFYHVVPADEYFTLMRVQKKMSVNKKMRCYAQKIRRYTRYVSSFKNTFQRSKKNA